MTSSTGRIEAFSDGIFSIAMTLLVLDLKVPAHHAPQRLIVALAAEWPTYLAYITSFLTVLVMWINHRRLFEQIHTADHTLLVLNGLLLMSVTLVPFPTALVAAYIRTPDASTATAVYAGEYVAIALLFNAVWNHAIRDGRLLHAKHDPLRVRRISAQYRLGPLCYVVCFALAFVSVFASLAICMLLAIYFVLPEHIAARRA